MCHSRQPVKLAMLIVLPFLLLCYGVGNVHCSAIHENREDLDALLDFKQGIISDPYGALSNWNKSIHFCHWNGVNCTLTRPWRVTLLNLSNQNLAGHVSSSLGNLTFLSILDLSSNSFTGPLPILNSLQQLVNFRLNNNQLHGVIPHTLTNSSKFATLDLSENLLVGSIPRSICSLSSLKYLNLKTNQLEGSIPDDIANFSNTLTSLLLGDNKLSGPIPQAVFNLYNLQELSLEHNMLGGELPPDMGALLPNLIQLTLSFNMIEGHIPASLGNVSGIQMIDLGSNNFNGQIPNSFGNLSNLSILSLLNNSLEAGDSESWGFLQALTNCSNLIYLDLGLNQLQGTLPDTIGNLSVNLQHLGLGWNNLSGILPPSIWNLSGLNSLSLGYNSFSGTIDEQIGNLKGLQGLHLHDNSFVGTIPSSIGSLTNLEFLELYNNNLEGAIPPTLGNLKDLSMLDLSYNKIVGDIPRDLGKLQQLINFAVSSNKLSGEIPDTLGTCQQLVTLQMDQNFLIGDISTSFSKLKGLITLNLSHNNLSGTIPTSLTDLVLLSNLDLSYNHLQGDIPTSGIFSNATAVSLYGNLGLCGGVMALHMPPCTAASQKTKRQYYLVRLLIPIFGFMSLVLLIYFVVLEKKRPRRKYLSNPYFGEHFLKVTYNDLAQATSNFSESNLVGRGSYGSVYRGKLKESKMEVAVKVFDLDMRGAERSFLSECEALRSIQHRNLLPILTVCSTVDSTGNVFKALVYEFMPNGNLDAWIHIKEETKSPRRLTLKQRINIVVNIADALDYMHHDCGRPTIHCDLKPSNILLDDDMIALLADFGIASFYADSQTAWKDSISSVGLKGTIGYIAPEYGGGVRQASTSMDVYSFGIVLLEILTGKRPTDPIFKDGLNIVSFVEGNFPHQIVHVIDDNLLEECKGLRQSKTVSKESAFHECIMSLLQVALSCTHSLPSERKSMKEIASKIHAIKLSYVARNEKHGASQE